jgi:hypothetical protein
MYLTQLRKITQKQITQKHYLIKKRLVTVGISKSNNNNNNNGKKM